MTKKGKGLLIYMIMRKLTTYEFIEKAKEIHGDKYDYSLVDYKSNKENVKIICPKHGIFEQWPNTHLRGWGCDCSKKSSTDDFIKKSIEIHENIYDYSLVEYKGHKKKIKIICPVHGVFTQTPCNHLNGHGCYKCKKSLGEKNICNFLTDRGVKYIQEKIFNGCTNISNLRFDFYLPDYNLCIEYNGRQHYEPIEYFGGESYLQKVIINDKLKIDYCKSKNIELVVIKYDENILTELSKYFK